MKEIRFGWEIYPGRFKTPRRSGYSQGPGVKCEERLVIEDLERNENVHFIYEDELSILRRKQMIYSIVSKITKKMNRMFRTSCRIYPEPPENGRQFEMVVYRVL